MRQLTSLDAQFLAVESARNYGHVSGLAVYDPSTAPDGRLDAATMCRVVGERLHLLPPFRWKLAHVPLGIDHPYWIEDPDFDLDFHIRELGLPEPGDDRRLAEQVARIVARPLDRSRPLWELYVIHGLQEGRVALLTKIHHSVVDGVSGAEILSVLLDLAQDGREIPPPEEEPDRRVPSTLELLGRAALNAPRRQLAALATLPAAAANLPDIPGTHAVPGLTTLGRLTARAQQAVGMREDGQMLERPRTRPPQTRFNGRISAHRRFAFGRLSLDTVKQIKNELGVTVNDVVVALCATMLRDWLIAHDELPARPLVAMIPLSVRTEEQMGTFGNRVSMMAVPVATNEPDTRRRVLRTHEALRSAKEQHKAIPAEILSDLAQFIPPALAARVARTTVLAGTTGRVRPVFNVVISNVPGPQIPLYCAGATLEAHYPVSVILDGVGLNITVMSYMGHLDFGIVADYQQVDDVWPMIDGLSVALEELAGLVKPANGRRASRPAKAGTRSPAGG